LFIVEDAAFLIRNSAYNDVVRIPQSIPKCQYLVFADRMDPKIERLKDTFMEYSQVISYKGE